MARVASHFVNSSPPPPKAFHTKGEAHIREAAAVAGSLELIVFLIFAIIALGALFRIVTIRQEFE